jgi:hypothetical protein
VVTQLVAGTDVQVSGAEKRDGEVWYLVRFADGAAQGWIRSDLVEPAAPPSVDPQAAWQMRPDLIPAIDRCLEAVTARPALVTEAAGDGAGGVGVRLMDAEGRRWSCAGDAAGSAARVLVPVQATDRLPGEFRPLFLRAPDRPTPDPCYRHEPWHGDGGQIGGWLSFGLCS